MAPWQAWGAAWNVAGGVRYHLQALRWRRTLWAPYTAHVAATLVAWRPATDRLVVVGPSAGWHLPAAWLAGFTEVVAIEPDPLARWLLRRRFPAVRWRFDADDYFTPEGPRSWADNTGRLLDTHRDAAALFANFLGQLVALYPDAVAREHGDALLAAPAYRAWQRSVVRALGGRPWLSLHDRLSSDRAPRRSEWRSDGPTPSADLAELFWPRGATVIDHLSDGWAGPGPCGYQVWQRKPAMFHVIETVGPVHQ
ncbi:MAG: hypothetical protein FJ100_04615 [Deltaproteobacteria bacterium]|nr:hypothetical protein [Deltaproteobacteria bacterium]